VSSLLKKLHHLLNGTQSPTSKIIEKSAFIADSVRLARVARQLPSIKADEQVES
jgi:hypothetical protein